MGKHTPGPWKVQEWDQNGSILEVARADGTTFDEAFHSRRPEEVANAHLIAAAPDLYAVVTELVRLLPDAPLYSELKRDALAGERMSKGSEVRRFFSFVQKTTSCWLWTGGTSNVGYGVFWAGGRSVGAHRYSLEMTSNPPDGKPWALHRCDNKRCVNPDHLYWGDHSDNTFDAVERGRMATGQRHGSHTRPHRRATFERCGTSKLSRADVLEIKKLSDSGTHKSVLAAKYKVNPGTVYRAVTRADALLAALEKKE